MPVDPALGGLVRELRKGHRLTLASLAKRVGSAESLISRRNRETTAPAVARGTS